MRLRDLIRGVEITGSYVDENIEIDNVQIDSRYVGKGSVFVAMKGKTHDGVEYVGEAIEHGASVIVSERLIEGVPCVVVRNIRQAYAIMSANFFGCPQDSLKVIAVIGTNGKSTSAYFIAKILEYNGYKVGLIGTGIVRYGNVVIEQNMTTPDPMDLHGYFAMMRDAGIEYVVMEVSAQAIYFEKMYGISAEIGLFTNLSEDHLDFFYSMDIYKRVKMSYFNSRYLKVGIVNSDDKCGQEILSASNIPIFTYGLENPSDVFAIDLEYCVDGTRFVVNMLDEISHFATEIVGKYNVYNILGASLVARLVGVQMYGIREAVSHLHPLEGRYNVIQSQRGDFVVDYAHTPLAMECVINETRRLTNGNIFVVFGCGGDRDRSKRPIMGAIASNLGDTVILTADNSRSESTLDIIKDIEEGISRDNVVVIEDRRDAIRYAYEMSNKGDTILVLGKGAESYQDNGITKTYYSDREAIIDILKG